MIYFWVAQNYENISRAAENMKNEKWHRLLSGGLEQLLQQNNSFSLKHSTRFRLDLDYMKKQFQIWYLKLFQSFKIMNVDWDMCLYILTINNRI